VEVDNSDSPSEQGIRGGRGERFLPSVVASASRRGDAILKRGVEESVSYFCRNGEPLRPLRSSDPRDLRLTISTLPTTRRLRPRPCRG